MKKGGAKPTHRHEKGDVTHANTVDRGTSARSLRSAVPRGAFHTKGAALDWAILGRTLGNAVDYKRTLDRRNEVDLPKVG